jgi:monoamine oxidase
MIDLAIVGAGAAGISAAREAKRRGLSYTVLEASELVGGRARTINWDNHHLDLGAGWLHSADRNPLVGLATELQLKIDRVRAAWRGQYRELGFSREDREAAYEAFTRFNEQVANPQPGDVAAHALPPQGSWNAFIEALSGFLNGASLKNISATDYAAYWNASTEFNWRLPSGYGALIERLAAGLSIVCGFAVNEVDWTGKQVQLSSQEGSVAAERAIITVSTNVLAGGGIGFRPGADRHLAAAAQLPLGYVEKTFFALEQAEEFPDDAHLIGTPHSSDTGSYMLRPMGIPVIEAFFGGDWVGGATANDIEARARAELGQLLGRGFDRRIRKIAQSGWRENSRFKGSYSYAHPGMHTARERLAEPVEGRVAFAGEACSRADFSTVHGAWKSGILAVDRLFGSVE